jgi:pilin isopeptide linkage protein
VSLLIAALFITGMFTCQVFALDTQSSDNVSASFEVSLDIQGDTPQENIPFTFVLSGKDGAPVPSSTTVTINGEGTAKFGTINFTRTGIYEYQIYQRDDAVVNYTYDYSVYTVDVYVTYDTTGDLVATYCAYTDDVKKAKIEFVNKYSYDSPVPFNPDETEPTDTTTQPTTSTVEETTSTTEPGATETTEKNTGASVETSSIAPTPSSDSTTSSSSPKTGDYTNNTVWMLLLSVTIIGMICSLVYIKSAKKRSAKQNKK